MKKQQTATLVLDYLADTLPTSYEVVSFKYMFDKDYDRKGNIVSGVKGGNISLTLSGVPTDELMGWVFNNRKLVNGQLLCKDDVDDKPKCHLSFEQARCVKCKIKYSLNETTQLGMQLTINATKITMEEVEFLNN